MDGYENNVQNNYPCVRITCKKQLTHLLCSSDALVRACIKSKTKKGVCSTKTMSYMRGCDDVGGTFSTRVAFGK